MESSLTFAGKPKEALIAACALIESQEERTKLAKNAASTFSNARGTSWQSSIWHLHKITEPQVRR